MQNAKCRIKGEATLPSIIKLRSTVNVLRGFCFMSAGLSSIIYSLLSIICYLYVDSKARRGRIHASRDVLIKLIQCEAVVDLILRSTMLQLSRFVSRGTKKDFILVKFLLSQK